jgi:hypothetical protein
MQARTEKVFFHAPTRPTEATQKTTNSSLALAAFLALADVLALAAFLKPFLPSRPFTGSRVEEPEVMRRSETNESVRTAALVRDEFEAAPCQLRLFVSGKPLAVPQVCKRTTNTASQRGCNESARVLAATSQPIQDGASLPTLSH